LKGVLVRKHKSEIFGEKKIGESEPEGDKKPEGLKGKICTSLEVPLEDG